MSSSNRAGWWLASVFSMIAAAVILVGGCSKSTDPEPDPDPEPWEVKNYTYTVVNEFPHDDDAFTQGLVFEPDGYLYEGTGLHGESTLRRVNLVTGAVVQVRNIPARPGGFYYFGEGISIVNGKIYQLTWQDHVGFIYDRSSFDSLGQFTYQTEGWGLTHDGDRFIMSSGSSYLFFRNLTTMALIDSILVHDTLGPVAMLNELEYIEGEVWANIWLTQRIARIDPESGRVLGYVNLEGLLAPAGQPLPGVLNGIAYDTASARIFVTGKNWPKLFEIEVSEEP